MILPLKSFYYDWSIFFSNFDVDFLFKITSDSFPVVRVPDKGVEKKTKATICKIFSESTKIRTEIDQNNANQMYHF